MVIHHTSTVTTYHPNCPIRPENLGQESHRNSSAGCTAKAPSHFQSYVTPKGGLVALCDY